MLTALLILVPSAFIAFKKVFRAAAKKEEPETLFSPLAGEEPAPNLVTPTPTPPDIYTILFLGLDKRFVNQTNYRTDAILLATILDKDKKIILTSIPRDLWIEGAKINSFYCKEGFDTFAKKIKKITGIEPDSFISADFNSFVWAINQVEGVKVNVERDFTDYKFPDDRENASVPPKFTAGVSAMKGEKALQYCRSRKGTNGEGSDFQRMVRQQNLLEQLPKAYRNSDLLKLSVEALYKLVTKQIQTSISVKETTELLPVINNWDNYSLEKIVLDTENFLYQPNSANYGEAYVLKPKGESFDKIKNYLNTKIDGTDSTNN